MTDAIENTAEGPFGDGDSRPELPAPDFDFLVYSLRLQAEMSLGLLPFAEQADLDLAQHHIDLLAMLLEKTMGNLTTAEKRSLDNCLAELRIRFVQAKEQTPA